MRTVIVFLAACCTVGAVPIGGQETCRGDGCDTVGDEASLLALKHRTARVSTHDASPVPTPEQEFQELVNEMSKNASIGEAFRYYHEIQTGNTKVVQEYRKAVQCLLKCDAKPTQSGKTKRCAKAESLFMSLPQRSGFNTTMSQVAEIQNGFNLTSIYTFSRTYAIVHRDTKEVMTLALYAWPGRPFGLIVNGSSIRDVNWTTACEAATCLLNYSVATWNRTSNNPTSGRVQFKYIIPYVEQPDNFFTGPFAWGHVSESVDSVADGADYTIQGVPYQGNAIKCSGKHIVTVNFTDFTTFPHECPEEAEGGFRR